MRRSAGLVRVVADNGAFLVAVNRLDRGITVEDPRLLQQRTGCKIQMTTQPVLRLLSIERTQSTQDGIITCIYASSQEEQD